MVNERYIYYVRDAWYHTACTLVLLYSYVIPGGLPTLLRFTTKSLVHNSWHALSLVGVCAVQQQVGPVSVFDGCGFLAVRFALW